MRFLPILLLSCVVTSVPAWAQQGDDCSDPMPLVGTGTFAYDATGATPSALALGSACQLFFWDWIITWVAPASGDYIFDVGPMDKALFQGSDCSAVQIGCALYTEGAIQATGLVAGTTYLLQLGYFGAPPGPGSVSIHAVPSTPVNDDCSTPTLISGYTSVPIDFTSGTDSTFNGGSPFCESAHQEWPPWGDIFYEWTATQAGDVLISLCSMSSLAALSVYSGSGCSATCMMPSNAGACAPYGSPSAVLRDVQPGQVFTFQIGHDQSQGLYPTIAFGDLVVAPAPNAVTGDDCSSPISISGYGTTAWDTAPATASFFDPSGACLPNYAWETNLDLFYVWDAPTDGPLQIDTIGSPQYHMLWVHEGDDCSATCVTSSENTQNIPAIQNSIQLNASAGDSYLIQIAQWRAYNQHQGVLNISDTTSAPTNDTCATPIDLPGPNLDTTVHFENSTATTTGFDGGDPVNCMSPVNLDGGWHGQVHGDLFFTFTAAPGVSYSINSAWGLDFTAARINVFLGDDCNAVCLVSANDPPLIPSGPGAAIFTTPSCAEPQRIMIQIGGGVADQIGLGRLDIEGVSVESWDTACSPANPHHDGWPVVLCPTMGTSAPSGLHLEALQGPAFEFGLFLVSSSATSSLDLFNGVLCLDEPIGRYSSNVALNQGLPQLNSIGQFDGTGRLQNVSGTGTSSGGSGFDVPLELPFTPVGMTITPGSTWYFQLWYRDEVLTPGDSANFSHALGLSF